jgi:integrase
MVNRRNYLWAKEHLKYLAEVMQLSDRSIKRYWSYFKHLLLWADEIVFSKAPNVRPTFPTYLKDVGANLAPTTLKKIVNAAKRLFVWLKLTHPTQFRTVTKAWIDALRPPRVDAPAPDHVFVTLEEVVQLTTIEVDGNNLALRRDQASVAFLYLSGMRGGAFGSLPLEAVDLKERAVKQWPSLGVRTKNGKSATTYLFEIPELLEVVEEWDAFVRPQLPSTAMWYTPIITSCGQQRLSADPPGDNRNVALARRIRKIFAVAGLQYKSPHKFRHGHAVYGLQHAHTMADYKAISMNLMHKDIRVTDGSTRPWWEMRCESALLD